MRGAWLFTGEDGISASRGDLLELRDVRHLIRHQQQAIDLPGAPAIALRWVARTGGTFGPVLSRAENARQRHGRSAPPSPRLDRGKAVAWHVSFVCGRCGSGCRILFNPLVRWRCYGLKEETIRQSWGCQTCGKYKWPSQRWSGTSRKTGRRPPSHLYQRHQHAAERCIKLLEGPRWLHWDRFLALERKKNAHLLLAAAAACASWPGISSGIDADQVKDACQAINASRWVTRQRSWARKGSPRPGPQGRWLSQGPQSISNPESRD
jgi:hypothetical protein